MNTIQLPEFESYEDEAEFWDNLDTGEYMADDGQWFTFDTPRKRAVRVAILPEVVDELAQRARSQGVSIETIVNVLLVEHMHEGA